MMVLLLGSQASGSTWLFNVVRQLFERSGSELFALAADDGLDALDRMPLSFSNVLVKSHSMDQRLIRIAKLAGAKLIISIRDPLDSVVSQQERFGLSINLATVDLTRSFASIASLPTDMPQLCLRYEGGFMRNIETIRDISQFIGIPALPKDIAQIFGSLQPNAVRADIEARLNTLPPEATATHDPATHWHPNHVGDGRIGKWRERFDEATRDTLEGCLAPLVSRELWQHHEICWSGRLFQYNGGESAEAVVELTCDGSSRSLVYGPYLHLPRGRWEASPIIQTSSKWHEVQITADVFLPNTGKDPIARQGAVRGRRTENLTIEFDHGDHFQPVEVRLKSVAGSRGDIRFSGCSLRWLGSLH